MSKNKENIRCGNCKEISTRNGKTFLKVNLNVDTLAKAFEEYGFNGDHGRIITINLWPTKDNQYGYSHDVMVDTWKPDPNYQRKNSPAPTQTPRPRPAPQPQTPGYEDDAVDDIPF